MIFSYLGRIKLSDYWKDIAWVLSGNSIAQLIAVLFMPILTRLYTPSDFALQTLFIQIMGGVGVILSFRYEYLIQLPKRNAGAKSLLILVGLLCIIGTMILTPIFWLFKKELGALFGNNQISIWLVIIPITAGLYSFSVALQHYFQRQRKYRVSSMSEITSKSTYVGTAIIGSLLFSGAIGLIISQVAASIGKIISLIKPWRYRNQARAIKAINKQLINSKYNEIKINMLMHFRLSFSLVISHLMLSITMIIPTIFINKYYGSHALGQFALVASTIYLPSILIGNAIGQVYYQRAAERWSLGSNFIDLWYLTSKKLLLIALPIYIAIALLSPKLYPIIFGDNWQEAGQFARVISIAAFFSFISSPLDRSCLVVGVWWYIPLWHTFRAITTGLTAWFAEYYSFNIQTFVIILVCQMTIMYLIDYFAEWYFAHYKMGKENVVTN